MPRMAEDLRVGARHEIPGSELIWRFGPTGGPGGQHANRAHTRAELRFNLGTTDSFEPGLRSRMLSRIKHDDGVVTVSVDVSRSQFRNRQLARKRLSEELAAAMVDPTPRRPTKPSRSQRRQRLEDKRRRSERKRLRRPPEPD